jgi:hypothetical protein
VSAQTVQCRLEAAVGIADILSAGFEVPVLAHARSFKEADEPFQVGIRYGGTTLADSTEPVGGLGDARLSLSAFLRDPGEGVSLIRITAVLKVPCGRRAGYFGTGAADAGIFLDATVDLARGFYLHGLLGCVHLGDPRGLHGGVRPDLGTGVPFAAGIEARLGWGWAAIVQVEGVNNVYPRTGAPRLDEHAVQATAGFSWRFAPGAGATLSFSEDLSRSVPDFTGSASLWASIGGIASGSK